jgi:hypothetical protein
MLFRTKYDCFSYVLNNLDLCIACNCFEIPRYFVQARTISNFNVASPSD